VVGVSHGGKLVLVESSINDGQPVRAVSWLRPEQDWDSGFAVFRSEPDRIGDTELVCLDCLLDDEPGIGKGLDVAREHGEAVRNGSEWIASV
jgi:hypothetical protein